VRFASLMSAMRGTPQQCKEPKSNGYRMRLITNCPETPNHLRQRIPAGAPVVLFGLCQSIGVNGGHRRQIEAA
jgi:hypothetical protein